MYLQIPHYFGEVSFTILLDTFDPLARQDRAMPWEPYASIFFRRDGTRSCCITVSCTH